MVLRLYLIICVLFGIGCQAPVASAPKTLSIASSALVLAECASVPDAVPNDGLDDAAAIRTALAAGGCVKLGSGTYDLDMPPPAANGLRPYGVLPIPAGGTLIGDGHDTFLHFRGDAGGRDWFGIEANGQDIAIRSLFIDTLDLVGTSEQTHAVRSYGPASFTVDDVTFDHPQRGLPGGDCITAVGSVTQPVKATVTNNLFLSCDRGGFQSHGGTVDLFAANNTFYNTGDVDIDGEGSGAHKNWTIVRNTFHAGEGAQGGFALALDIVSTATIVDNIMDGRGIYLYSCDHCSILHNKINRFGGSSNSGVVEVVKGSDEFLLADNEITRASTVEPGWVVHVGPSGTKTPANVRLIHNQITQNGPMAVVGTEGVVGLTVADNAITYAGPVPSASFVYGLLPNHSAAIRATSIFITKNTFTGAMRGAVGLSGSYAGTGRVAVLENTGSGLIAGLICDAAGAGGITGPIIFSGNTGLSTTCAVNIGL